ncbi:MAG: transcription antitermination factor NusB [Lachnospiraceae bacterium]|nr:transcription antitermination factor NusB [Lachnospiraceae bacterium]
MDSRLRRTDLFKILFQTEFQPDTDTDELVKLYNEQHTHFTDEDEIAIRVKLANIVEHLYEIDDKIENASNGWKLDRIGKAELAILRLSIYEILYENDSEDAITADEAVRLTKEYADDKSPQFVNGILGSIIRAKDEIEG